MTIETTEPEVSEAADAAPGVEILEVAIHALDHRKAGLTLSSALIDLTRPALELFTRYVVRGLQSDNARMAKFLGDSEVGAVSRSILQGELTLLDGSHRLGQRLFDVMRKRNPGPGDLAVIRAHDPEADHSLIALLKLDLQTGFRRELVGEGSRVRVRLSPVGDLLPESERRIQKAAYIPEGPHSYPYDLMVIDNQASSRSDGRDAAGFFTGDFLQCDLLDGPKEFTRRLPQEAEKWIQEEGLYPSIAIDARQAVIRAIQEPEVDLVRLADELTTEPEQRSRFMDRMESSGFAEHTFQTDRGVADRMTSTLTYILDGGIRISGDAETLSNLLQVDTDPTEEGKVRILIESARFERKY